MMATNEISLLELADAYEQGLMPWKMYIRMLNFYRKMPIYVDPAIDYFAEEGQE